MVGRLGGCQLAPGPIRGVEVVDCILLATVGCYLHVGLIVLAGQMYTRIGLIRVSSYSIF